MTDHPQDHALIIYADNGITLPRETLDAIGPRGVLILPSSMRPEPQELRAFDGDVTVPPELIANPGRCPTRSAVRDGMPQCELKLNHGGPHRYPGAAEPGDPAAYRGKRRADVEPSTEVCGARGMVFGEGYACDRPAGHTERHRASPEYGVRDGAEWEQENAILDGYGDVVTERTSSATAAAEDPGPPYAGEEARWGGCPANHPDGVPETPCQRPKGHSGKHAHHAGHGITLQWEDTVAADPWAEGTGNGYSVPHLRRALEKIAAMDRPGEHTSAVHMRGIAGRALAGEQL